MHISFVDIIEFIGTFAFAISGIRLASAKQFDLFGAFVVGLVTAIGGGTIRDLLLDVTPFWMSNPIYFFFLRSIRMPITVLIRLTASAPASSHALAMATMSVTLGESFTITGLVVTAFTARVTSAAASGCVPKLMPPP